LRHLSGSTRVRVRVRVVGRTKGCLPPLLRHHRLHPSCPAPSWQSNHDIRHTLLCGAPSLEENNPIMLITERQRALTLALLEMVRDWLEHSADGLRRMTDATKGTLLADFTEQELVDVLTHLKRATLAAENVD